MPSSNLSNGESGERATGQAAYRRERSSGGSNLCKEFGSPGIEPGLHALLLPAWPCSPLAFIQAACPPATVPS
eukprot:scaffold175540_cov20-Tisochrysis_lutea.AAC.2